MNPVFLLEISSLKWFSSFKMFVGPFSWELTLISPAQIKTHRELVNYSYSFARNKVLKFFKMILQFLQCHLN